MITPDIYFDVLAIPDSMYTYTTIMKGISYALIPLLFICGIVMEQAKILRDEKPEFLKLILTTFFTVLALYYAYDWLFLKIVAICEAVGMSLFSVDDWSKLDKMLDMANSGGEISVMKLNMAHLISSIFVFGATIAESVFELIRYSLLSFLYVVGPLAFVFGIFPHTRSMLKGWFINVFQISFWIITLRALEATMLSLKVETAVANGANNDAIWILSGMFVVLVILTPIITSKIVSSGNIVCVVSLAMAMATSFVTKYGSRAVKVGGRVGSGISAVGGNIKTQAAKGIATYRQRKIDRAAETKPQVPKR